MVSTTISAFLEEEIAIVTQQKHLGVNVVSVYYIRLY